MLAAGLPIITGHSIGDIDILIEENEIGHIVKNSSTEEYKLAIDAVLNLINDNKQGLAERCNKVANSYFSMEKAIDAYDKIYHNI